MQSPPHFIYPPCPYIHTMNSAKSLSRQARSAIPHGVNSPVRHYDPYPFFADHAQGCHIWDTEGHKLIDLCNGYGSMLLGHRHPDIIQAVQSQLNRGTLFCTPTSLETDVSSMLCDMYPSIQLARMVNTGGEATMAAIRLARGYTGKSKIVMFEGGYHGAHDSVLVRAGSGLAQMAISSSAGIPSGTPDNTILARYNDTDYLADILESHNDVAAVIVEPVMANMGLIPPDDHFLEDIRHITKQHDTLLIFDEVITGFRMSLGGAQAYYSVTPDITTLAKALGNGFAVSVVGGRKDIMEMLAPGGPVYQASTFAGNPISAAAAAASMRTMRHKADTMYDTLEKYCIQISGTIRDTASDLHIPCQVNAISSMLQVFFTDGTVRDAHTAKKSDTYTFAKLFGALLRRGIFVAPSQFETVFLSDAISDDTVSQVCDAYAASIQDAAIP